MRRRLVLVALLLVAAVSLGGYALARPGPASKVSRNEPDGAAGWTGWTAYAPLTAARGTSTSTRSRSYPITSLPPGKLILARLRLRLGAPYFIYGQRIRFQGRRYFCLSAGNPTGSFQTCPPWPLAHGKTDLLLGGGPPLVELALDINSPAQQCTFVDISGGPYRASRVPLPASLKIQGDLYYAFVKRPPGDGIPRSTKTGTSVQFMIGSSGRARCGRLSTVLPSSAQTTTVPASSGTTLTGTPTRAAKAP